MIPQNRRRNNNKCVQEDLCYSSIVGHTNIHHNHPMLSHPIPSPPLNQTHPIYYDKLFLSSLFPSFPPTRPFLNPPETLHLSQPLNHQPSEPPNRNPNNRKHTPHPRRCPILPHRPRPTRTSRLGRTGRLQHRPLHPRNLRYRRRRRRCIGVIRCWRDGG